MVPSGVSVPPLQGALVPDVARQAASQVPVGWRDERASPVLVPPVAAASLEYWVPVARVAVQQVALQPAAEAVGALPRVAAALALAAPMEA